MGSSSARLLRGGRGAQPQALCLPVLRRRGGQLDVRHARDREDLGHARRSAVEPRVVDGALRLECSDLIHLLQCEPDVVEPVEQAVLAEGVHFESEGGTVLADDRLGGQVDLQLVARIGVGHELHDLRLREDDGEHAVLEAVVVEDVGEGGRDDAPDTHARNGPGSVLARGAATEVLSGHEDRRLAVLRLVEHEALNLLRNPGAHLGHLDRVVVAQLGEGGEAEAGALDRLEVLLWNDHVRIHVCDGQRGGDALQVDELGHSCRRGHRPATRLWFTDDRAGGLVRLAPHLLLQPRRPRVGAERAERLGR
mmetsp:Transcript_34640/g.110232  ORF Transcript_34640/g.110232 Transcript_34640/m.110232 type:complete len:309 (+) Transcript_34640:407-1333(+)